MLYIISSGFYFSERLKPRNLRSEQRSQLHLKGQITA